MNSDFIFLLGIILLLLSTLLLALIYGLIISIRKEEYVFIIFLTFIISMIGGIVFFATYELWLKKWGKNLIIKIDNTIRTHIIKRKHRKIWKDNDEILINYIKEKYLIILIKEYANIIVKN